MRLCTLQCYNYFKGLTLKNANDVYRRPKKKMFTIPTLSMDVIKLFTKMQN